MLPKISIIVAVYNGEETLQRCIDSVSNQTYQNRELLIIDGGSTDNTVAIIKRNSPKVFYWESKPDKGIYHAWNKALSRMTGDWVCFLGADDLLYQNDSLDRLSYRLDRLSNDCRLAYGRVSMIDSLGNHLKFEGEPWEVAKKRFFVENTIPHQGVLHHRDLFLQRKFDIEFSISADYEFILWAISAGYMVDFLEDMVVAKMQVGGVSNSPKSAYRTLLEFLQARRKHGYRSLSLEFVWVFSKSLIKKVLAIRFRC